MANRDYYVVLGVSREESPAGIRAAFRERAKRLHPDHAGGDATPAFQEVQKAYEVLSDPERRRAYNRTLAPASPGPRRVQTRPRRGEPLIPHPAPLVAEPVVPEPRVPHRGRSPLEDALSLLDDAGTVRPGVEPLLERLQRNFTHVGVPKSERPEAVNVEVLLTPDEAAIGGELPIAVPVLERCWRCHGGGYDWFFPCDACGGEGVVEAERLVHVEIPPHAVQGATIEVPLTTLGIDNLYLRVRARIDAPL
jgi:DnaJ-class molecular chaperone